MWKRQFKKVWALYRHVSAVRGLLQWLGWWAPLLLAANTAASAMLGYWASHVANVPTPLAIVLGLFCLVALLFLVALAIALWRVSKEELRPKVRSYFPDLRLGMGVADDGLLLWLENQSSSSIEGCTLFIEQLAHYSEKDRSFCGRSPLTGVWLIKPAVIRSRSQSDVGYVVRLVNPDTKFLEIPDATGTRPVLFIREPGIWRATINLITSEKCHQEHVFFRWTSGQMPEFIRDPRVLS